MFAVPNSLLFLGRPGVGKTTVIRDMARVLSDELHKRVVIVDTSNEIGGDGDVPHPAIGGARRMQVQDPSQQHKVMVSCMRQHSCTLQHPADKTTGSHWLWNCKRSAAEPQNADFSELHAFC